MKKYLLMAAAFFAAQASQAQVANYRFTHESGQFLELANYPGAVIMDHIVQDDFLTPGKVKMGFPFSFGGQIIDSVGVHENGYLFFGSIAPFAIGGIWPISSQHPSQVTGIVSALGLDLHPVDIAGQKTTIKSAIVGTAPLRIFIAEWKGTSRIDAPLHPAGPDDITFQIRLYETTNRVELTYGDFDLNANITDDAEIGIRGATFNDYSNRVPSNPDWTTSTAGFTQMARTTLSATNKPIYGNLYVWEPSQAPTAIDELNEANAFRLYPVPANDVLHIEVAAANGDVLSYEVTDMAGRRAISGKVKDGMVMVSTLRPGTYMLMLHGAKGKSSRMFVKS